MAAGLGRGRCAGEGRIGAGVSGENREVVRGHDGDTLVEGAGLAEDNDVIAEALVGGRLYRLAGLGRAVLGVAGTERGQDLGTSHLLAVDGEGDVFALFLHWSFSCEEQIASTIAGWAILHDKKYMSMTYFGDRNPPML